MSTISNHTEKKNGLLGIYLNVSSFYFFSEDMIEDMMKPEFRNYIRDLSSSKYGVIMDAKPNNIGLPHVASFRKLNID